MKESKTSFSGSFFITEIKWFVIVMDHFEQSEYLSIGVLPVELK